jgi:hypothetical protein
MAEPLHSILHAPQRRAAAKEKERTMSQRHRRISALSTMATVALTLTLGAAGGVSRAAAADVGAGLEGITFYGQVVTFGDLAPRSSTQSLRIRVRDVSELAQSSYLADIYQRKGEAGLEQALFGRDVGFVQFGDRLPEPIAAAFVSDVDGNRHLTLLSERNISPREIWGSRRSAGYRFRVIEVDLDATNHGSGTMFGAARFRKDKSGDITAQNLGILPWRIMNLKPL